MVYPNNCWLYSAGMTYLKWSNGWLDLFNSFHLARLERQICWYFQEYVAKMLIGTMQ